MLNNACKLKWLFEVGHNITRAGNSIGFPGRIPFEILDALEEGPLTPVLTYYVSYV